MFVKETMKIKEPYQYKGGYQYREIQGEYYICFNTTGEIFKINPKEE